MGTILRQAISNSARRENYLMERRIHKEEIPEADDNIEESQDQESDADIDKAECG